MEATYVRPYLYPKQNQAFFTPLRYSFIEASTKAGKTVAAIAWIIEQALGGQSGWNYWWVAPVSDQSKIAYTRIKLGLTMGTFTSLESPTPKITLANGAIIWFKSGDNPDSLYGEDVYAAVVDEASRVKEESWNALRSTLTATRGPVRVIGNVKGRRNWFYKLSRIAESEGAAANMKYTKITIIDAIEAGVIDKDELEDARRTITDERVFRELYFAEPGDDGGNPFGVQHIAACVARGLSDAPPVAFGIDLAKKQDWLVVIGLDVAGAVCVFQRWQGVPWNESIKRIQDIVGEDIPALVDSTGLGDPVLEQLQIGRGNFSGYTFTALSKQKLMEGLSVSIQGHDLRYPEGPIRIELDAFEYELTRTGVRYSAPEGMHDDCVCALALAREQWSTLAPAANLMAYYMAELDKVKQVNQRIAESGELSVGQEMVDLLAPADILDNELTTLYLKTLDEYTPQETRCNSCGHEIVGQTRVSDGRYVWHRDCVK